MATSIWKAEHRSADSPGKAFSIHPLVPFLGLLTCFMSQLGEPQMSPQKWGLHWLLRATLGESGEPVVQTEWTAKKASQKAKEATSLREKKKKKIVLGESISFPKALNAFDSYQMLKERIPLRPTKSNSCRPARWYLHTSSVLVCLLAAHAWRA